MSRRVVASFLVVAAIAAACGGPDFDRAALTGDPPTRAAEGNGTPPGDDGSAIEIVGEDIAFVTTEVAASAGIVRITFDNRDVGIMHNLHVSGGEVDESTEIEAGPTRQDLELQLEAGTYSYVCDVHPAEMTGELSIS